MDESYGFDYSVQVAFEPGTNQWVNQSTAVLYWTSFLSITTCSSSTIAKDSSQGWNQLKPTSASAFEFASDVKKVTKEVGCWDVIRFAEGIEILFMTSDYRGRLFITKESHFSWLSPALMASGFTPLRQGVPPIRGDLKLTGDETPVSAHPLNWCGLGWK